MPPKVRSVAIIGAGASGAVTAAALHAEDYFESITVYERRETAGGTWIYDPDPGQLPLTPGALPPDTDPPLPTPHELPSSTPPSTQYRFSRTPIYEGLTTNVPDIAMSFTDLPFAYGPFVPHWIAKQYIENYFSAHKTDAFLELRTTVEQLTRLPEDRWRLVLRRHDPTRDVDEWWEKEFDAVVIANGHYSVPFIPAVPGLDEYMKKFPDRIQHSKSYRSPAAYTNQRVLVVGNSASGYDVAHQLAGSQAPQIPIYVSRRSRGKSDGDEPPAGIAWKPIITQYTSDGSIVFSDSTVLHDIDQVVYCTGYQPSYPFWNTQQNGRPLYDYTADRLINNYQHTFLHDLPTLALIGIPRVLTFRSFEYQGIAVARLWSARTAFALPAPAVQKAWELQRAARTEAERRRFHRIDYDGGETLEWFDWLFHFAGLPRLVGEGRFPPVLSKETRWAIEHVRKYPEGTPGVVEGGLDGDEDGEGGWEVVGRDSLWFI